MIYKYQIVFLGDLTNPAYKEIGIRLEQKILELGLLREAFDMVDALGFEKSYNNKQPTFAYYFGKVGHSNIDEGILTKLMDNGDAILPVCFKKGNFANEVPGVIGKMNGKLYTSEEVDTFVNYALESLRLLRQTRKLFISYRRSDSTAVANQLFDVLLRRNYDVFLDDYSIAAAKDFQEELHHRLSDCDVLIQLYTEHFRDSKWCNEEITAANQKQIGIVALIWPGVKIDPHDQMIEQIYLTETDFDDDKLKEPILLQVALQIESVRARNMASRQDNLVGEFIKDAHKVGRQMVQEYMYLIERRDNGEFNVFIPAVGVPQSIDCYESLKFRTLLQNENAAIYLIYDDLRVKDKWIKHLDWLNESLEVKTIKKKGFAKWLQNN